jgi:hypothetical protein
VASVSDLNVVIAGIKIMLSRIGVINMKHARIPIYASEEVDEKTGYVFMLIRTIKDKLAEHLVDVEKWITSFS